MTTHTIAAVAALVLLQVQPAVRPPSVDPLGAFNTRVAWYVDIHREVEGPIPAIETSRDMDEVHLRMRAVRIRILGKVGQLRRGHLLTADVAQMFRRQIAAVLTRGDLDAILADVIEHSPPGMPPLRVQEPLPEDAPFVPFPPRLFSRLPALPPELRYLILEKALVVWDHHADLIVDIAPGLFDPSTYPASPPRP
jgi:hypothetical protein